MLVLRIRVAHSFVGPSTLSVCVYVTGMPSLCSDTLGPSEKPKITVFSRSYCPSREFCIILSVTGFCYKVLTQDYDINRLKH